MEPLDNIVDSSLATANQYEVSDHVVMKTSGSLIRVGVGIILAIRELTAQVKVLVALAQS